MSLKTAFVDFEYFGTAEAKLNLVCASLLVDGVVSEYWLLNEQDRINLRADLHQIQKTHTLVAYNVEAEASSLISLGLNPLEWNWIDLYLEYRLLQNHHNKLLYGKQYIDGKIVTCFPFGQKGKANLGAALYKLCGLQIDTDEKAMMRNLIISGDRGRIENAKDRIQKYCTSDVTHLPKLLEATKKQYLKQIPKTMLGLLKSEARWRAEYGVRTAIMVRHGYPINIDWARNLTDAVPTLLRECAEDINSQFADIKPFNYNSKSSTYSLNTKAIKEWIERQSFDGWERTEKNQLSLAKDAWEKHFSFRHEFPRNNFGAQMLRYLKLKESVTSFNIKEDGKSETFWDSVGSDNMVRPYMNIYGAQSSRSQPKSRGFLFLKSAWVRAICQAPAGYAIGAIDYSSQEFLLSAVCSMDPSMLQAYREGDVYLYYGKGIKMIPENGTKATHGKERDLCKSTVLGLSYMMSKYGLSTKLTQDTGRIVDVEEAQKLIDAFEELFQVFADWRQRQIDEYQIKRYLKLADGWYMFGDNDNPRSVGNVPLQGYGAVIMRKAVQLAQDAGLNIIFTLHDSLYVMYKSDELSVMDTLRDCMYEAFHFYFNGEQKEAAKMIRVDSKAWSPDYTDETVKTPEGHKIDLSTYHVDSRAKKEYEKFSKYFTTNPSLDLL